MPSPMVMALKFLFFVVTGMDMPPEGVTIKSWLNEENWDPNKSSTKAAHPNSRFCTPAQHCPIMDKDWENPKGVPISGILFGGRRPEGVPLVFEAFNWQHGVFVASAMSSETTAAAEFKGKAVMRDPFAMRPFFGYNVGKYMEHWLRSPMQRCRASSMSTGFAWMTKAISCGQVSLPLCT